MEATIVSVLQDLGASPFATWLRGSFWTYPLVNAAHILGIALLVGSILPLDLRLMGFLSSYAIRPLARLLIPIAALGLGLASVTGVLLFLVKPVDYVRADLFLIKLALIGAGCINVALVRYNPSWISIVQSEESLLNRTQPDFKLRLAGGASLVIWIAVLVNGRLIGYFM